MNSNAIRTLAIVLAGAGTLQAQMANPFSAELKQTYVQIKAKLTKMAQKMPEEDYSYKPTPETRTFGQIIGHVTDTLSRTCSALKGEPESRTAPSKSSKPALVAALNDSFSVCDHVFDSMTDTTMLETFIMPPGQHHSKAGLLMAAVISHSNEEYGYMAVYLRMKGIVPPSSEAH
jgi:DinB superfamily